MGRPPVSRAGGRARMSTLHGPFEGWFVGLPSPDAEARGVSRFHDLRLDWGTLRPGRLVDDTPASPADPTPVEWPVLGPILAELENGQWYRLWLHDARLHWGRPRLARDDGDRSLWCVRGHLVGRLAAGPVAEPRRFGATWVDDRRAPPLASGCGPLLALLLLALAAWTSNWLPALLAALALLAAAFAWRASATTLGPRLGVGLAPDASWLLPLALAWLLLHWLFTPCLPIPGLLWIVLLAGALAAASRAGRLGLPLFLLAIALPIALTGWQRTGCRRGLAPGAVTGAGARSEAPVSGVPEGAPAPGSDAPAGGGEGEGGAPAGARNDAAEPGEDEPDAAGPGSPDAAGEWPSLPARDPDADLVEQASRGPLRRIGLDAALSQGRLECGQTIHMSGDLLFPLDSAKLRPESLPQLRKLHRVVQASPEVRVKLVGHADETGLPEHNDELSRERARAVGDWLLRWQALPSDRLDLEGHGESEPLVRAAPGSPLQRLNRRVDVVVSCPGGGDAGQ